MIRALHAGWIVLLGHAALCHASVRIEWQEVMPENVPATAFSARVETPPVSLPETFRRPVSCRQNSDKIKRALFVFETDATDASGAAGYAAELDTRGEPGVWQPLPRPSIGGRPGAGRGPGGRHLREPLC